MRLWLLRHAKSSWSEGNLRDEDRPLAPRGERAADRIRDYLDAEGIDPELALCSSALRARETLARVLPALGTELEVRIEPTLYTFEADVILDRLGRISSDVTSALLVGHNPAYRILRHGSPTAAMGCTTSRGSTPPPAWPRSLSATGRGTWWRIDGASSSGSSPLGIWVRRDTSPSRRGTSPSPS
jgi:phosphohistidine phosphatase SixA